MTSCPPDSRPPLQGSPVGGCGSGFKDCNAVIGASAAIGMGASGTITITLTQYRKFRPMMLRFIAADLDVSETGGFEGGFNITSINLLGKNYLGTASVNASFYALNNPLFLSPVIADMDMNTNLTIGADNVDSATDLTIYAVLDGIGVQ